MKKRDLYKLSNLVSIVYRLFIYIIFSVLLLVSGKAYSEVTSKESHNQIKNNSQKTIPRQNEPDLKRISLRLLKLKTGDTASVRIIADSVRFYIERGIKFDSTDLAEVWYQTGKFYLLNNYNTEAIIYFKKTAEIFEKKGLKSQVTYSDCLYNTGLAYYNLGDFTRSINFFLNSVENDRYLFGDTSLRLIDGYTAISANYILMRDYEKAIEFINIGLKIPQLFPDSGSLDKLSNLYANKGVAYSSLANYDQAKSNLEKAESYYNNLKNKDLSYINTLDNLGTVNHFLGLKGKSYYYYEKGLKLVGNDFSSTAFNLINNYAILLGNDHLEKKGELILSDLLKRVQQSPGNDPRNYYLILKSYADYLREYKINNNVAIRLYLESFNYIKNHPWDKDFRDNIILGYSLSLFQNGEYNVALDSIQTLLFPERSAKKNKDLFINPGPDSLKADGRSIKILNTKYKILWSEYRKTNDIKLLEAAAGTSELIITVLEKIRLSIGEEGSRLLLGDKYRDSYMDAIMCLTECYSKTNNQYYLEKAFECTEKSKVASLLASTREMKAIQNHIPSALADKEKELQRNIGFYSSKIAEEENSEKPDRGKINLWNDFILVASQQRDSIIKVFERSYPEYYSLKYNTKVISLGEIPELIGKGKNYLSYIVSDSNLYIIVSNNRYRQLITQKIDSSFFEIVAEFRKILTTPDMDENAKNEFYKFQGYGHKLYSFLIEPVKKFLISDKLIISPDNILSYIPFETFITGDKISDNLIYRNLPYLMDDFRISYAYSATLLAEYEKVRPSLLNSAIIFAPTYDSPIYLDSISNDRQSTGRVLSALPHAKQEAEYISVLTCGTLYAGTTATESVFKETAGKYDIIHLAMHTYIDIQNPIFSRMFFSVSNNTHDNNGLDAFEVYGIPLKAKMVVLSSCNTGSGNLRRGEGILSLARGFIYSGSKSVVMSLWEVDDRSGTDIVKSFYRNLKNGNSKSDALRKARLKYLKSADQLRSHPYFWSTLVIYGDDSSLYYSTVIKLVAALIPAILIFGVIIYYKKR